MTLIAWGAWDAWSNTPQLRSCNYFVGPWPLSSLAYPMITHTPLVAGNLQVTMATLLHKHTPVLFTFQRGWYWLGWHALFQIPTLYRQFLQLWCSRRHPHTHSTPLAIVEYFNSTFCVIHSIHTKQTNRAFRFSYTWKQYITINSAQNNIMFEPRPIILEADIQYFNREHILCPFIDMNDDFCRKLHELFP